MNLLDLPRSLAKCAAPTALTVLLVLAGGLAVARPVAAPGRDELPEHPARAGETVVTWEALDTVLIDRHAGSEEGKFILEHLLKTAVLAQLADERGVEVSNAELSARWKEVDRAAVASGAPRGLLEEIEARGMTPEDFRELLRLGIVHERLTREALGLAPDAPVSADQQNVWLEQTLGELGVFMPPAPWSDGIAARCGNVTIRAAHFAQQMRTELPGADVREACMQLLLVERMRARMPDLSREAEAQAIAAEIQNRRERAAANPTYLGVDFDALLRARGMIPERFAHDPAVVATALATLWVERTHDDAALRSVYEEERSTFEERYGEAVLTHLLFLSAAQRPNALQPRSVERARGILTELGQLIATLEDFTARATALSEDPYTKRDGGRLGWVTRGAPGVPVSLRDALFERIDAGDGPPADGSGMLLGPVELDNGVALLWMEQHRPSPAWAEMSTYVRRELRGRMADEVLPPETVETFLDPR